MNLFEALLVGHLVGDYLLQTRGMAYNKDHAVGPLLLHSAVYTLCVFVFSFPVAVLPVWSILFIFISHAFLDQRSFLNWWIRNINGSSNEYQDVPFMRMIVDQSFHLLVLAMVAYASAVI